MRRPISVVLAMVLSAGALVAMPVAPAWASNHTVGFAASNQPGLVEAEGTSFTFTVELSEPAPLSPSISVDWRVENIRTANDDFQGGTPPSDTVTFVPTMTTATFQVPIADDSDAELDDSFVVVLSNPRNATLREGATRALGHVIDNDTPRVTISGPANPIAEPASGATTDVTFTLALDDGGGTQVSHVAPVHVTWRTVERTASDGADYVGVTEHTTMIPAGQETEDITVKVKGDTDPEGNVEESFEVELVSATRAVLSDSPRASASIDDDDGVARFLRVLRAAPQQESGTHEFTVVRSQTGDGEQPITVRAQIIDAGADHPATRPEDNLTVTNQNSEVTIEPNQESATFGVVGDDTTIEQTEQFTLKIESQDPPGVSTPAGADQAIGTILDDDGPTVSIDGGAAAVEGNGEVEFTASLGSDNTTNGNIVVGWTAYDRMASVSAGDYATSGTVTFPDGGEEERTQTLSVPIGDDVLDEPTESFLVVLTDPGKATLGTTISAVGTIWDDDFAPTVRVRDTQVFEGESGTTPAVFNVELDKASGKDAEIHWRTVDTGSADDGNDYVHVEDGVTVIPAGEVSATLEVLVKGDPTREPNETFDVDITDATTGASIADPNDGGSATGTILNDDGARFVVHDASDLEGDGQGGSAVFAVELLGQTPFSCQGVPIQNCPGPDNPFVVQYATQDGTDDQAASSTQDEFVDDIDYVHTTGELSFAPGEFDEGERKIKTVAVPLVPDNALEYSEWFTLDISLTNDPANEAATIQDGSGRGTVVNDDGDSLKVQDVSIGESSDAVVVPVQLDDTNTRTPSGTVRVRWETAPITEEGTPAADADTDYEVSSGVVEFPSGASLATFAIPILPDLTNEPDEGFLVRLFEPDFAEIDDGEAVVTIVDDDGAQVDVGDVQVTEGADSIVGAVFDVTLSEAVGQDVTVDFATVDGTATVGDKDYLAKSGTLTIPAGETSATITVEVLPNPDESPDETFALKLSNPTGAVLGKATGTATIIDAPGGDGGGGGGGDGELGEVFRSAGEDRIATAVTVSADHWPSADAVAVATAWMFPDALAGGALAAGLRGPLLLSDQAQLPQVVADEIERLGAKEAWILGGPAAIGPGVEQALQEMGLETIRLAGFDRFETAAEVARAIRLPSSGEVMLALGHHPDPVRAWPDALSAGSLAASTDQVPTLLTRTHELPAVTEEVLAELGAQRVRVLGGSAAISDAVVQRLVDLGYEVDRLAGATRYGTTVAVAQHALLRHPPGEVIIVFATGQKFPDGLAAGALAARFRALVVLVPPDDLARAPEVENFLAGHADRFDQAVVVGGSAAVTDAVRSQLAEAMQAG